MGKPILACVIFFVGLLAGPLLRAEIEEEWLDLHRSRLDILFAALDPSLPTMAQIQAAWEQGKRKEAVLRLLRYYATKEDPSFVFEELPDYPDKLKRADDILKGRFFVIDDIYPIPVRRATSYPDYNYRGPENDKEFAWMLNRMAFLPELLIADQLQPGGRYIRRLDELWRDWILTHPYPNRLSFSAQWRALEVARRILRSWIHCFYQLRSHPDFSEETRLLVLCSVLDHADSLREHASFWGGNHLITEKVALLGIACAFPEFAGAPEWKTYAINRVSKQLFSQSYPDGAYKELSNHYQRVILMNTLQFTRFLMATERDPENLPVFQRIEKMWRFFALSVRPDGFGPLNNAGDREWNIGYLKEAEKVLGKRDWSFLIDRSAETPPPETVSILVPYAGQAFLRKDWSMESPWVYFDAGPYGTAHQHVDRLHVSYFAMGRPILTDAGRYTYQPGKWTSWFKGPRSHNVLLVNGEAAEQGPRSVEVPLPVVFRETAETAMASASTSFTAGNSGWTGPIQWNRSVELHKASGVLTVTDDIMTFAPVTVEAIWNFAPGITPSMASRHVTLNTTAPIMDIRTVHGQESPYIGGWHSPDYNIKNPATQRIWEFRLKEPSRLIWTFLPETSTGDSRH